VRSAVSGGGLGAIGVLEGMTASGPQCVRNRCYDLATGLSTQPDPIGLAGGLNLYGYAGGDPINYYDPFGLCAGESDVAASDTTQTLDCTYSQSSGDLSCTDQNGEKVVEARGYSGRGEHKNAPASQSRQNLGPIPQGSYTIGPVGGSKGPWTIALIPDTENQMFGRHSFLIHGDSRADPGNASEGCIVVGPDARRTIAGSRSSRLTVTP
jgi:uncharacterized protein RhaS with RHS repeats